MLELLHPAMGPTIAFFCLYGHVWACPSFFVCREERVVRTIAPRLGGPWGGVGPWEPFWRVPDAQGTRRKPYNSRQLVADPASYDLVNA